MTETAGAPGTGANDAGRGAAAGATAAAANVGELAQAAATAVDKLVARWKAERAEVPSAQETTEINLLREDLLNAVQALAEQAGGRAAAEEEAAKKVARAQEETLRAKADFLNYQDRQKREFTRMMQTTMRGFVEALVPWMDNFELSLKNAATDVSPEALSHFRDAMQLTHDHLLQVLGTKGLKRFGALGQKFNPALHESLTKAPAPDKRHEEVIEEVRPGYQYQDLLLRPASVVIAENPGNPFPTAVAETERAEGEEPLKD